MFTTLRPTVQKASNQVFISLCSGSVRRPVLLTASVALMTVACIIIPRVGPLVVIALTMITSVILLIRGVEQVGIRTQPFRSLLLPALPFVAWILVACLWSANPGTALSKALFLSALILHAFVIAAHVHPVDVNTVRAFARGLLIGVLAGGLYVALEIALDDAITRFVLTYIPALEPELLAGDGARHSRFHNGELVWRSMGHSTRITTALPLLLVPALIAAEVYTRGFVRWFCYAAFAALFAVILFHSNTDSQTGQLVIVVALAALALALAAPKLALWGIGAGFCSLLLLAIPTPMAMFSNGLHTHPALFNTARQRVVIWNHAAEQALEHPVLGMGTYSTRFVQEELRQQGIGVKKVDGVIATSSQPHAHNVYLEIWSELGVVGALAFGLLGLSILSRIRFLPRRWQPFALAQFAACATVIAPSYSMWQTWFSSIIVTFALALIFMVVHGSDEQGELN